MFWAIDPETKKTIRAEPGRVGICPMCHDEVRAKCGTIYCWHWQHIRNSGGLPAQNCDPWHEHEGEWHREWKSLVPENMREYVIRREYINPLTKQSEFAVHRADILNSRGTTIELQHSRIPVQDVHNREQFYEDMIWLFDAKEFEFTNHNRLEYSHLYKWRYPRKYIWECTKPIFFHMGGKQILRVEKISKKIPCYIIVSPVDKKTFLSLYFQ